MFSKFKISGISPNSWNNFELREFYKSIGQNLLRDYKNEISNSLDLYLRENGHLDANQLSGDWFPEVDTDIFISHSHADEDLALILAGWLNEEFGLKSFIDSTVWGNIADLQKQIDAPLLLPSGGYDYDKRNQSTAYVHLLLSTALTKMMDNSEAIFFLSTDNSLKSVEENITESVWIYHEIFTSKFLRKKLPERMRVLQKCFSGGILEAKVNDGYKLDFSLDLNDFKSIDSAILNQWNEKWSRATGNDTHPLDILYQLFNRNRDGSSRLFG